MNITGRILALGLLIAPAASANQGNLLNKNMQEQQATNTAGAQSQKKVTAMAEATRTLADDYRLTLRQIESTKVYNQQIRDLITSQKAEMKSIDQQIEELKNTGKEITPLMVRMLNTLEKFVALDVPFLPEERQERITKLKTMMKRADVSVSEKYRRILEAYQVENEYGRTIESYRGIHKTDGKELTVDFLRVGRLALMFQSLDGEISGIWDTDAKSWTELPSGSEKSLRKGIKIARKQMAPDLIRLPMTAPQKVEVVQ